LGVCGLVLSWAWREERERKRGEKGARPQEGRAQGVVGPAQSEWKRGKLFSSFLKYQIVLVFVYFSVNYLEL
jgi:hypothetical protein